MLLLHLCGPAAQPNSQLFSAAQSRDQAALLFGLAAKIVRMSPHMNAHVTVRDTAKQLYCGALGTLYRALSADATTAYGLSPVFIVHDELGQVRGPRSELYEALETATGAQMRPLSIVISTQAPTDGDLLSILIDDAKGGHDPRTVLSLHTADPDIDPFTEEAIRQANPAFGDFQNADEVLAMAEDARRMPSRENEFRNLVLNQRVEAHSPFVSRVTWEKNTGSPLPDFAGQEVYGGLDLALNGDLASLVLICKRGDHWHVKPRFFLPENGLAERSRAERVDYMLWRRQGFVTTTPGNAIQYEFIAHVLNDVFGSCTVRTIAYDAWGWKHLRPWLEHYGFSASRLERFIEFGQGYKSMSPALGDLERLLLDGMIEHGGHPVLDMCAANSIVTGDPAGNRKLDKVKSTGRIDGMVALAMATGAAALDKQRLISIFENPETASINQPSATQREEDRIFRLDDDDDY